MNADLDRPLAPASDRGRRRNLAWRWLRRNGWSVLAGLAVMATLIASVAVVRVSAGSKDRLRRGQIALASTPGAVRVVLGSPLPLLAGQPAAPSEYPLSASLRENLAGATAGLRKLWDAPLARRIDAEGALLNSRTARMMTLISEHRLRAANLIHDSYLNPLSKALGADIVRADAQLTSRAQAADQAGWTATLLVVGLAGALLVLSMLGLVTARVRRERGEIERVALRESEQRLQALVEHGSDMITVIAPDTTVLYQAGAVRTMLGYEPGEIEGARLTEWLDPEDEPLLMALCSTERTAVHELRLRHRDGGMRTFEAHATSLLDHPAWGGVVLNIWDVSERKELEERLRHQAFHDTLTGLPNRALFADRVQHALVTARRGRETIAVLLIDLDDFKSINDSLGHATGDQLLIEVAARLHSSLRGGDTVARLGGDEFAVILDGASAQDAERAARRILASFTTPVELDGRRFPIAASVGVARTSETTSATELVRDADVAMYMAKGLGKNRHAVFEPSMHLAVQERLELKADLVLAAADLDQFKVYYQPIVTLDTGAIAGLEALLRWHHPVRGLLPPARFIALAEEIGAILPIGRSVLNQACREARRWSEDFEAPPPVSVNVSSRQLEDPGFVADVREALRSADLAPERLVLEITESRLMANIDQAAGLLQEIKDLGVRIALDDFGTGYLSLSRLQRLPIDIVKIDRDFAGALRDPKTDSGLIRAVMDIAQRMALTTVAERIETPDQLHELQGLYCPLGQGFLFSEPVPAEAIHILLAGARGYAHQTSAEADPAGVEPGLAV